MPFQRPPKSFHSVDDSFIFHTVGDAEITRPGETAARHGYYFFLDKLADKGDVIIYGAAGKEAKGAFRPVEAVAQ